MWSLTFNEKYGIRFTINQDVKALFFVEVINLLLNGNFIDGVAQLMYQLVNDPLPDFFLWCRADIALPDRVEKR